MREIAAKEITAAVRTLCIEANCLLPPDVEHALRTAAAEEPWPAAQEILGDILRNVDLARTETVPLCQDTGLACVFADVGQEVHIVGGTLEQAVNEGVRQGYEAGYLRKSVVEDPIDRVNTGDNTPAILHVRLAEGDALHLVLAPKGAGSENMSRLAMLKPSDGVEGVQRFVLDAVRSAGPNPCPPIVVGVGVGGNFETVALLAKRALLRAVGSENENPVWARREAEWLEQINETGIGPQGFGGKTTALALHICTAPTHIAMLPVAVNINCHVTRHKEVVL